MKGVSRAAIVDLNFRSAMRSMEPAAPQTDDGAAITSNSGLTVGRALELFESQAYSRHLDLTARELKKKNQSFYTIGSSGHEGNVTVAAALRVTDPAFLHYRSGAFYVQRARAQFGSAPLDDVLLGITASRDEPMAGGRHKVFGSRNLHIPPQTSTIASHLPKAVGMAMLLDRRIRFGMGLEWPKDAIVVCSFGDASINHHSAIGAINAACWAAHQQFSVPILLLCEDNGLGISVPTPKGWIAENYSNRRGLRYRFVDGRQLDQAYDAAQEAVNTVRRTRRPLLLHMQTVRLMGHAGSDVEQVYRRPDEIEASEASDPLIRSAVLLVESGYRTPKQLLERYKQIGDEVREAGNRAAGMPKLLSAPEVMQPLAPLDAEKVEQEAKRTPDSGERAQFWEDKLPEADRPRHLARLLNYGLGDLLVKYPQSMIFGEDVAKKGGVYHVTQSLSDRAGIRRVFNTLLDEETILGVAIGAGMMGYLPIPEIQYLAYLHNAIDQLRGEACSLQFFSTAQYANPMVVRIASYAYQKGFGGHFHNDNAVAALREIPGLIIASPSRGADAVLMLRTCMAAAAISGRVSVFLEPIARYMTRDLYEEHDHLWCDDYPGFAESIAVGRGRTYGDGESLTIVSFANGLWMSLRVAKRLEQQHGIRCRVLDLRWLSPLPVDDLLREANATGRVLVVDETRRTAGVSEGVITALIDNGYRGRIARVCSEDSYIPLGAAANLVLVSEEAIETAALDLARQPVVE